MNLKTNKYTSDFSKICVLDDDFWWSFLSKKSNKADLVKNYWKSRRNEISQILCTTLIFQKHKHIFLEKKKFLDLMEKTITLIYKSGRTTLKYEQKTLK